MTDFGSFNNLKFANFTLEDIHTAIKDDEKYKKDIMLYPKDIEVSRLTGKLVLNKEEFNFQPWSLTQFCGNMNGLTPKYFESCPNFLKAENANYWYKEGMHLKKENEVRRRSHNPSKFMWRVRTGGVDSYGREMGQSLRGIASEKYRKFDDIELMDILTKILNDKEYKKNFDLVKIADYSRTDAGFHLKLLFGKDVGIGETRDSSRRLKSDTHYKGLVIENSETGRKAINIKPFVWRQICSNGLMAYDFNAADAFKQRHIGIDQEELYRVVAQGMIKALEATDDILLRLLEAKEHEDMKEEEAKKLIERYSKECKYDKKFVEMVKDQYKKEKQNTFGVIQSFTRAVQDFEPYKNTDDRVRVEQDAGRLLVRLTAA